MIKGCRFCDTLFAVVALLIKYLIYYKHAECQICREAYPDEIWDLQIRGQLVNPVEQSVHYNYHYK